MPIPFSSFLLFSGDSILHAWVSQGLVIGYHMEDRSVLCRLRQEVSTHAWNDGSVTSMRAAPSRSITKQASPKYCEENTWALELALGVA